MAKNKTASPSRFDEAKWAAENDFRTLCEASAIKKDPKRLEACKKIAKDKLSEMKGAMGDMAEGEMGGE